MLEKPIDRWLGLGSIAMGIALFLLPKSPAVVIVCAAIIFVLLIPPVWNFWWIERNFARRIVALVLLAIGCLLVGKISWTTPQPGVPIIREIANGVWKSAPARSPIESDKKSPEKQNYTITARDIRVRMVYPKDVGFQLLNLTDIDVEQVRCALRVWDLDVSDGDGLLPLTQVTTDWMNTRSQTSQRLSDVKDNLTIMQPGDRLFGIVGVACKGCKRERDILFYVSPRDEVAWYVPWARKDFPDWKNLGVSEVISKVKINTALYLDNWAPRKIRIKITDSLSDVSVIDK